MEQTIRIAILGAGNVGGNLGINLSEHGYSVRFGVRDPEKIAHLIDQCGAKARAVSPAEAVAWADVLFLAVPHAAAIPILQSAGDLTGKIVVDCCNPVAWADGPILASVPEGSVAALISKHFPTARVVKGFCTFGAEFHRNARLNNSESIDVQLASDDAQAKETVATIASHLGFSPVDCGPLRNATLLENLAVLWIHLAVKAGFGRECGFKLIQRA